ncbi:hypothetical protein L3V79_07545 [Thiotrichales bacterium 19S9-12]|nr:hypothetical protein [Thiotrichales bacterium 19S9-11]MCF6812206.1 hypothetical protein [Thiotrichales bacterium 19S9-12]
MIWSNLLSDHFDTFVQIVTSLMIFIMPFTPKLLKYFSPKWISINKYTMQYANERKKLEKIKDLSSTFYQVELNSLNHQHFKKRYSDHGFSLLENEQLHKYCISNNLDIPIIKDSNLVRKNDYIKIRWYATSLYGFGILCALIPFLIATIISIYLVIFHNISNFLLVYAVFLILSYHTGKQFMALLKATMYVKRHLVGIPIFRKNIKLEDNASIVSQMLLNNIDSKSLESIS